MADLEGYSQLQARLTAIGQTRDTMRLMGLETVREAKVTVPRRTGTTGRTIRLASVSETSARITVGGAGIFIEDGTRAHDIVPVRKKALRWPAQGTPRTLGGRARTGAVRNLGKGAFAFAKRVHIRAQKPRPFLIPAARKAIDKFGLAAIVSRWNGAA